jgi:DNA (cytosine-5)-methyltransferase 1
LSKLRVFEAFAGVGSQRMALRNLGINHEVVAISEVDKHALKSYEAIHGDCPNLGDISKLTIDEIPDHDLFTYSFPCQDISIAGRQDGFSEGSGTRSSLLWECRRVIEGKKPRYLLLENVKNLVGKKNRPDFDKWLEWLEGQGYTNYWQVLNAKDHNVPQNRERIFVVSILGESSYKFPTKQRRDVILKDVLEDEVLEKFYLREDIQQQFVFNSDPGFHVIGRVERSGWLDIQKRVYSKQTFSPTLCGLDGGNRQPKVLIKNATSQGYLEAVDGDGIDLNFPDSKTRRGRVQSQRSHTLTTGNNLGVLELFRIRKLTPLECWRLMGFTDEDFAKAKAAGVSDSQLYKQAGNSIVVPVLEGIFRNLFLKEAN